VSGVDDSSGRWGWRLTCAVTVLVYKKGGEITKSFAFTLEFRAPDRTLTGEETEPLVERVVAALARGFGAQLRAG